MKNKHIGIIGIIATVVVGLISVYFVNQNSENSGINIHIEGPNYGDISANQNFESSSSLERNQSQIITSLQNRVIELQNQIEILQKESKEGNEKQILRLTDEIKILEQAIKSFNERDFNLALIYFKDLETRYEKDDNIKNAIGATLGSLGNHEDAIQYFTDAIELNPNNDLALQNRGWAYLQLNKMDKAEEDLESILKIPNIGTQILDPILPLLYQHEFNSLALAYQERILQERPDDVMILEGKARIQHKLNELDNARTTLKKILHIDEKHERALFYLGVISVQLKEFDIAETYLNDLLVINPNHEGAKTVLNFIKNRPNDDISFNFTY